MYEPTAEEHQLVEEFDEATSTKQMLQWSAVGSAVLGIFVMPVGVILWVIAGICAVLSGRTANRVDRIRARVAELRTFRSESEIKPGSIVSLVPDPSGLTMDRLVGRVGSLWEEGGEAEILSEPLGGKQLVKKHAGSFHLSRGEWVVFHQEDDGTLAIWKKGSSAQDLMEEATRTGDANLEGIAKFQKLNQAQIKANAAIEDLLDIQREVTKGRPEDAPRGIPSGVGGPEPREPEVWSKEDIIEAFRIDEEVFNRKYVSYTLSLRMSGKTSNWNQEIDKTARREGALTPREIELAKTDFERAVLNRVKLALTMEGHGQ